MRVSDFRLPPLATAVMLHTFPTVRWQVGDGAHHLRGADVKKVKDRQVFWAEPGTTWEVENRGSDTYRQMLFEIKQPPKYTEEEVRRRLQSAVFSTDVGTELLFENHLCRVWDFFLDPGAGDPKAVHHHVLVCHTRA